MTDTPDYAKVFSDVWNANRTVGLSGHTPDGEAYLAAIHGGRAITANLAAKAAEVRAGLAQLDDFVTVGASFEYAPRTGILKVIRDDRVVESHLIDSPDGYWDSGRHEGYRVRNIGAYVGLVLTTAQSMFDWPIYREAMVAQVFTDGERTLLKTALENARESLEYAIDNNHYPTDEDEDGAGEELRGNLISGWTALEARL